LRNGGGVFWFVIQGCGEFSCEGIEREGTREPEEDKALTQRAQRSEYPSRLKAGRGHRRLQRGLGLS
jgi:hypothetical protein